MRTLAVTVFTVLASLAFAETLHINVEHRWQAQPLTYDAVQFGDTQTQQVSVTRLDYLLSEFSLLRTNGEWVGITNQFAFVSAREGRTSFVLTNTPGGMFKRVAFNVGLPPAFNHADPARFAPGHPLNPNVNGLHWNWQGGYVFLALEGRWRNGDSEVNGYSFHLATDEQLARIELPVTAATNLQLIFEAAAMFANIALAEETSSTHSRKNDALADLLRTNLTTAFSVTTASVPFHVAANSIGRRVEVSPRAKPFRFTFSAAFPRPVLPSDNPLTEEGVALGRRLFNDPLLSANHSQSCASCHDSRHAFSDTRRFSVGAMGDVGTRHSMPLFNLAWRNSFFWDGRAASLREQVLQPIENPSEMHESLTNVVRKLKSANYPADFAKAFGTPEISSDRVARALEQFLLTLVSHDSKFDRVIAGNDEFTAEEHRGFELFHTEYDPRREQFGADCFHCHGGPLFQNVAFANNGLDDRFSDPGRFLATALVGDNGKFTVPSLRNVEVTAPYMHDGRFRTLEQVIEHYSTGVKRSDTLDPNLAKHPAGGVPLSDDDKRALVAFLKTLTDAQFAPVSPLTFNHAEAPGTTNTLALSRAGVASRANAERTQ